MAASGVLHNNSANGTHPIVSPISASQMQKVWQTMRQEAQEASQQQPLMASFFHHNVLNHSDFAAAIRFYLANILATDAVPAMTVRDLFEQVMRSDPAIEQAMLQDLLAHYTRDAACHEYITPLLYFKGFHAISSYRIAHTLWGQQRELLALYLQSRIAQLFDVDIHPGATIAGGLMVDHATGVVIGETTVIEQNVSMLHAVTLGGSGSVRDKRHPTIREGVLLSAGAKVLGNVDIGEGTKVGAGSLVLESVPAHSTVVGVPARVTGRVESDMPALDMNHNLE